MKSIVITVDTKLMTPISFHESLTDAFEHIEKTPGSLVPIAHPDDLTQFSLVELTKLRNRLTGLTGKVDSKKKFSPKIWEKMVERMKEKAAKTNPNIKPPAKPKKRRLTKSQRLRNCFDERKIWTIDELVKESGFDEQNVRVALSILKNPARTKKTLVTVYDRKDKTYTLKKRG